MEPAQKQTSLNGLAGLRVLSLESRRAAEMAKLIANYGGQPMVAPSMQEVPLESNKEALAFGRALVNGAFDVVVFLTGVGARALMRVLENEFTREAIVGALTHVAVIVRGPKPAAALKELGVPVMLSVPEPHTWRELLTVLDARADSLAVRGQRVAVQEYGAPNPELLAGLSERGAVVTRVPVYDWALPDDVGPLRNAVQAVARGEIDMALFTTSLQVMHLLRIASEMQVEEAVRAAFERIAVGSIGPMTSETLREQGIAVDFEPAHSKMGLLVGEAAQRARELVELKRRGSAIAPEGAP